MHLCDRIVVQFSEYINSYPSSLRKRISAIANPVKQSEECAKPNIPNKDGKFVLLAVGRVDDIQKRFDLLVRAFASIRDANPNWQLNLFGDGQEEKNLRGLIERLNLSGCVHIFPTTQKIANEYQNSHLLVIPSLWEGFPNVLSEAMSCGLPAIGFSQAEGVNQLIKDENSGWLASGLDNPSELAKVLSSAMNDPFERIKRGKQAKIQMRKYQPEKIFDQWAGLLNEIIEQ